MAVAGAATLLAVNDNIVGIVGPNLLGSGRDALVHDDEIVMVRRRTAVHTDQLLAVRSPTFLRRTVCSRAVATSGQFLIDADGRLVRVQQGEVWVVPTAPLPVQSLGPSVAALSTGAVAAAAAVTDPAAAAAAAGAQGQGQGQGHGASAEAEAPPTTAAHENDAAAPFAVPLVMVEGQALAVVWPPHRARWLS